MANFAHRASLWIAATLMATGAAYAQQQLPGNTSGPAAGGVVLPSTVVQKLPDGLQQGRSVSVELRQTPAGGMPGVEALPGTEGGRVPANVDEDRSDEDMDR